jgi:hypothetical protein
VAIYAFLKECVEVCPSFDIMRAAISAEIPSIAHYTVVDATTMPWLVLVNCYEGTLTQEQRDAISLIVARTCMRMIAGVVDATSTVDGTLGVEIGGDA